MILPTKRISSDRSLLNVGARVLLHLDQPKTVSRLWDEMRSSHDRVSRHTMTFDWFVLALDMLFSIGAIGYSDGLIAKEIAS